MLPGLLQAWIYSEHINELISKPYTKPTACKSHLSQLVKRMCSPALSLLTTEGGKRDRESHGLVPEPVLGPDNGS